MRQILRTGISGLWCICCFIPFGKTEIIKNPHERAALHYQNREYHEALKIWYELADSGQTNAGIYYNIGITESLLENIPEAVFALEQALRIKPMNKEIRIALEEERKKIEQGAIPLNPFFLHRWYKGVLSLFRPGIWAMFGLVMLFMVVLNFLVELEIISLKYVLKGNIKMALAAMAVVCLMLAWLSYKQMYRQDEAIIQGECSFWQAPAVESPLLRTLYPGEKAIIKDQIGDWYHVHLLNLDAGWVKGDCLREIRI